MKRGKRLYLAYGSNLNIKDMEKRCPNAKNVGVSEIKDYELEFRGKKDNAYVTIKKSVGKSVVVGVWEISENDEIALDEYEEYPNLYRKEMINIYLNNENIDAMCYIMNDEYGVNLPTGKYVKAIQDGYIDFGFNVEEFNELVRTNEQKFKN